MECRSRRSPPLRTQARAHARGIHQADPRAPGNPPHGGGDAVGCGDRSCWSGADASRGDHPRPVRSVRHRTWRLEPGSGAHRQAGMTGNRARLIVNPSSGRERATEYAWAISDRLRERYGAVEIVLTIGDGDAREAAARAVTDGCDALFIAGGDGTVNEAVNGVAGAGALDRITFGIIPL